MDSCDSLLCIKDTQIALKRKRELSLHFIMHCPGNLLFLEYLFKNFKPLLYFSYPSGISYQHIKSRKAKAYDHRLTLYWAYILQPLFLPPVYCNIYCSSTTDPICFNIWSVCSHFLTLQFVPTTSHILKSNSIPYRCKYSKAPQFLNINIHALL